jgi:hypothetical protein
MKWRPSWRGWRPLLFMLLINNVFMKLTWGMKWRLGLRGWRPLLFMLLINNVFMKLT